MKFQNFSIAKIEFLWRALNFKRGHGPPFSAAYGLKYIMLLKLPIILTSDSFYFDLLATPKITRGKSILLTIWCKS